MKDDFLKKLRNRRTARDRRQLSFFVLFFCLCFSRPFESRLLFQEKTIAVLQGAGKEPVLKDVLTMSVMAGSSYGRQ